MIESINSIQDDQPCIKLLNHHGKDIYRLNSINLIIGDNGSGKTRLIKSIIRDLCNESAAAAFSFEGLTEELGLIYYTAAPFHQIMPSRTTSKIAFLDTSQVGRLRQRFAQTAQEYVEVRELLDLKIPVSSAISFQYESVALKLLTNLRKVFFKDFGSPEIHELHNQYRSLVADFSKVSRQKNEILKKQKSLSESSQIQIIDIENHDFMMMDILREEEARIINLRSHTRQLLVNQFLIDCRPKSKAKAIQWLAAFCLIGPNPGPSIIRSAEQIIKALYLKDPILDPSFENTWIELIKTTTRFINAISKENAGEFDWDKNGIDFTVDLPTLVKSNTSEDLIEDAHRKKLVNIGFHTLSSGEAAITHQLASISHGIHELAQSGKKQIIVFIDEGDLLLHLSWQRKYLDLIDLRLSIIRDNLQLDSLQVIVASHSPLLTSDILRDSIVRLGSKEKPTGFGAPLQQIVNYSFGTTAIGSIAERTINNLKNKKSLSAEDQEIVKQIDDDYIRSILGK